jgi:hypothetical protein
MILGQQIYLLNKSTEYVRCNLNIFKPYTTSQWLKCNNLFIFLLNFDKVIQRFFSKTQKSPQKTHTCKSLKYFVFVLFSVLLHIDTYRDVSALLVQEDLRCPSVHYFRHERAPE